MKKKMGIMEKDLRTAFARYKKDNNLRTLLRSIVTQVDRHIRYQWQYDYFQRKLNALYDEMMSNSNPSHREGRVDDNHSNVV